MTENATTNTAGGRQALGTRRPAFSVRAILLPLLLVAEIGLLAPMSGVRFNSWNGFLGSFRWYAMRGVGAVKLNEWEPAVLKARKAA